jgi:RNA-directed DNA polymerase
LLVDLDLEKFFDRVNHDRLMAAVAERVADKRMLKLIRAFLEAGEMEDGLVSPALQRWADWENSECRRQG